MLDLKRALAAALVAALAACATVEKVAEAPKRAGSALGSIFGRRAEAPATPPAQPAGPPAAGQPAQPPSTADLPPDPALRFGTLPNGMRYVVMKNATPPGQTSLRLRIDAGSLMETEDQRGLAHFLEHMAFNGSTNVPEGEMVKILERHGLAFGPDTNASTNFDQTVYELDLPKSDDEIIDTALMLLREATGEMLLDPAAIDRERGIVLSEERARATPGYRILEERYRFLLKGQLPPNRFPIGSTEVLRTASRERFVAFYNAYYRPERATLVAVGDFDPAAMEAKIRARFGSWRARGENGAQPDLGRIAERGTEAKVVVEAGGPATVQVAWINPPDLSEDSRARRRERLTRQLGFAVLNRRLERLARSAEPPFIAAGAFRYTDVRAADMTVLSVTGQPGQWRRNLEAVEQEQRRIVQWGVQPAELAREIAEYRTALQAAVAGSATRRTADLASGVVDAINEREVFTSDEFDLAFFEENIKTITAQQVSQELGRQFSGQGPLVFVTSPTPVEGGEQAVLAAFSTSRQAAVAAPAVVAAKPWPYDDFGRPAAVVETRDVLDLDTTFVRFANGVRLTVKPTRFRDDQVLVSVRVGDGYLDLPTDRPSLIWASALEYIEGGLGKLTAEEIEQILASKVYSAQFGLDEDSFVLSGRTRPEDQLAQLQVLAAYLTDPGWRPEPFERMRAYGATLLAQLESTPGGVFSRDGEYLLHSKDPRWRFPDRAQLEAARLQDLRAMLTASLARDPIEVVVVGDVNVDTVIEDVAATFGALPPRAPAARPSAQAQAVAFPAAVAQPVRLTHKGRPDQALAFIAFKGVDFPTNPQEARNLRMVEQVLRLRLLDELRERQGVTYSPNTDLEASWDFPGYGYVAASVEAPPDKLDGFFAAVAAIAKDLRERPITADELERARRPRVEAITRSQSTNEYWLTQLGGSQSDSRRLDAIRASISGLERVTPADVQRAAQTYLTDARAWKLVIVPEAAPAAAAQ